MNMKFEYIVVYENISDKFNNGRCQSKVKVLELLDIYRSNVLKFY